MFRLKEATIMLTGVLTRVRTPLFLFLLVVPFASALADDYADTVKVFKEAGQSAQYFDKSYGYAVFPAIRKAGIGIGGAHGTGRVYRKGAYVGDATMNQVSVGLQLGAQGFSQMIFFEDKKAFDHFTSGNFEFGAQASAIAITAGASAQASTGGTGAGASSSKEHATTAGGYQGGMAVFTVAKGGLMYEASIGGQKFSYKPKQ